VRTGPNLGDGVLPISGQVLGHLSKIGGKYCFVNFSSLLLSDFFPETQLLDRTGILQERLDLATFWETTPACSLLSNEWPGRHDEALFSNLCFPPSYDYFPVFASFSSMHHAGRRTLLEKRASSCRPGLVSLINC